MPLVTATELSPSSSYRFRVRARYSNGLSLVSGVSELFTTGETNVGYGETEKYVVVLGQIVNGRLQKFHGYVCELPKERQCVCAP